MKKLRQYIFSQWLKLMVKMLPYVWNEKCRKQVMSYTDVLGYFGEDYGYIVTKYSGSNWLDSWNDDVICEAPYYWIDLTDIESNTK